MGNLIHKETYKGWMILVSETTAGDSKNYFYSFINSKLDPKTKEMSEFHGHTPVNDLELKSIIIKGKNYIDKAYISLYNKV